MSLQALISQFNSEKSPVVPQDLYEQYKEIKSDPEIHSGLPHIKGTRILAFDIFRAQIQGYSPSEMLLTFKEMGIHITQAQINEASRFTLEWLNTLVNEKERTTSKTSK